MTSPAGYSATQIALHWAVAALVAAQFIFHDWISDAWDMRRAGDTHSFHPLILTHVAGGGLIAILVAWRLVLRLRRGAPPPPANQPAPLKSLSHVWFSTMYGVYYFAGSVWVTLATVYVITLWLEQEGSLRGKLHENQYYFIGSLFFAFTVFYAYIAFSQYFIIWNANIPEETFWYLLRDKGSWRTVGLVMIFGHFFLPFLALLRIDAKHHFPLMLGLYAWAWIMHFVDMAYNILPVHYPDGFPLQWVWLHVGCLAFMAGLLMKVFVRDLQSCAPYPVRDPRLSEALGHRHPVASPISGGEMPETDELGERVGGPIDPEPQPEGGSK